MNNPKKSHDDRRPRILRTEEVAELLGVKVGLVRKWIARGWLPSVKVGRRRWIREDALYERFDPNRRHPCRPRKRPGQGGKR